MKREKDKNLPKSSGLNNKTSDIVGQINLNPNNNFKINYDFAMKENLVNTSYELLGTELKIKTKKLFLKCVVFYVSPFNFIKNISYREICSTTKVPL